MAHLALAAGCAAACAAPAAKAAETPAPPSHLAAYNLDWLNYLDPADIPATRYAVCLVDTGVAITPDTPPDDPVNGPILARVAGDGGSGLPFDTSPQHLHGTRMAMAAAAPQNGWGTIGTATWIPIISVRATRDGEATFRGEAYAAGISQCLKAAGGLGVPLAAINFSLACSTPCEFTEEARRVLENRVAQAHERRNDVSIVASAGNGAGAVALPAAVPGVLAVAAGDGRGRLCSSASFGPEVSLIAPGCPVATADPLSGEPTFADGGSSAGAVTSSIMLAALRSLRPDAAFDETEAWLRQSARIADGLPVLDGEAAARVAGLEGLVARARGRQSAAPPSAPTSTPAPSATPTTSTGTPESVPSAIRRRLPRPAAVVRWRHRRLLVRLASRPPRTHVEVHIRRKCFLVRTQGRRLTLRVRVRPQRVTLRFVPAGEFTEVRPSRPTVVQSGLGRSRL